tara:strand:- start:126 stop:356 length:231 start_codon:yes stop_codon:yes gene_type:complete
MNNNQLTNHNTNHAQSLSIDTPAISIKGINHNYTQQIIDIAALPVIVAAFCAMIVVIVPLAPAIIAANVLMDKHYK